AAAGKTLACNTASGGRVTCLIYGMNSSVMSSGTVASVSVGLTTSTRVTRSIQVTATVASTASGASLPLTGSAGTVTVGSGGTPWGNYRGDQGWVSATNGWGPVERDRSNGEIAAGDGRVLTLNGLTYAKGLGVHANSDVRFAVGSNCTSFNADIGVDD